MLTSFQKSYIQQIKSRSDFGHFCMDYLAADDAESKRGPATILFYANDMLNLHYVGQHKVIRKLTA